MKKALLSDDIILVSGQHLDAAVLSETQNGLPYLTGPTDFNKGRPNATRWTKEGRAFCEPGDVLVVVKGSGTGASFIADKRYAIGRQLMAVRPTKWDAGFVRQILSTNSSRYLSDATGLIPGIARDDILDTPVVSFRVSEQRRIADILERWDEALEKLDALIAAKDRCKKALMQQLLTGKSRLPSFKAWKRVCLSDVAEECNKRNVKQLARDRLFAVTKAEGMVPMRENVQGATINRCKIVEHGWFAYNPMRINIGSIARWEQKSPVMVSPDYVVFRTKEGRLLSDYLNQVRRSGIWTNFVGAAGNGSVRIRIWFDDLSCFKFPLPSLDEQRAIAKILSAADTELCLIKEQRAAIDQQKRGLMQRLLTGRVRVKIDANLA